MISLILQEITKNNNIASFRQLGRFGRDRAVLGSTELPTDL